MHLTRGRRDFLACWGIPVLRLRHFSAHPGGARLEASGGALREGATARARRWEPRPGGGVGDCQHSTVLNSLLPSGRGRGDRPAPARSPGAGPLDPHIARRRSWPPDEAPQRPASTDRGQGEVSVTPVGCTRRFAVTNWCDSAPSPRRRPSTGRRHVEDAGMRLELALASVILLCATAGSLVPPFRRALRVLRSLR